MWGVSTLPVLWSVCWVKEGVPARLKVSDHGILGLEPEETSAIMVSSDSRPLP